MSRKVRTFRDLSNRLDEVVGVPFSELRDFYSKKWQGRPSSNKGFGGNLVDAILGADAGNEPAPDVSSLGIEIKTIPIEAGPSVQWPTKVTAMNYADVATTQWAESTVFHKLRTVLFVPIVKYDTSSPDHWYIRRPFLWLPSQEILKQLEHDYNSVRKLVLDHHFDDIHSGRPPNGQGKYLMVKPAAAKGSSRRQYVVDGQSYSLQPKAWMLRESFTEPILRENLALRLEIDDSSS